MSGKKPELPQAQAKRSSRLAAKVEEAVTGTGKRGRGSTGNATSPQQPLVPSKRGKQETPAPPAAPVAAVPVAAAPVAAAPVAAAPAAAPAAPAAAPVAAAVFAAAPRPVAVAVAPVVLAAPKPPAVEASVAAATTAVFAPPQSAAALAPVAPPQAVAAIVKPSPAPAPALVAPMPSRSSDRRDASQGLGGVLAAAQARKEASFNTQSMAPQRAPNPAAATRKSNAATAAAAAAAAAAGAPPHPYLQSTQQHSLNMPQPKQGTRLLVQPNQAQKVRKTPPPCPCLARCEQPCWSV